MTEKTEDLDLLEKRSPTFEERKKKKIDSEKVLWRKGEKNSNGREWKDSEIESL